MLEESFLTALNNQAPEITKFITDRKKKPWFGDTLKQQKRKVRRREKVFRRYRLQSCWIAFDRERKKYKKMLVEVKNAYYSEQAKDCRGDTKGLYKMVNTLMGTSSNYPLPDHANNKDLAEEFAGFFMDKIQKIRDNLTENPIYKPTRKSIPSLAEFRPFDQVEVKKIILSMKTKSCELDTLPVKLLKDWIISYQLLQT